MVRKNNDDNELRDLPPQQQLHQLRYGSASVDLIELNDDGTARHNSNHLKISPASAFKKASIKHSHELDSAAHPPLVFVGDNEHHQYAEEGGGGGGGGGEEEEHDEEVVMALSKDQPQHEAVSAAAAAAVAAAATTEGQGESINHITTLGDNDKQLLDNPKQSLHAFLLESEWKGLFTTLQEMESLHDFDVNIVMNSTNDQLETPLHTVCWKGPPQLAILMLETVPANQRKRALLQPDISGNTPLHLACANLDQSVDFTVIKNLLLLAPEALDQTNRFGDSPLHLLVTSPGFARFASSQQYDFSVEAAAEEAISSLLQMVGHLATVQNYSGLTLLHCAIAHGAHERVLVKLLTMAPSAASIPDNRGMLPIHFVAAFGGKHGGTPWTFVSQLIQAYEHGIVAQTENGDTALHLLLSNAAKRTALEGNFLNRNTTKLAELLVLNSGSCRVSPLLIKNKVDLTPLHCCALFDTPAQLTRLIMECSPVADQASAITTKFGATPLHLACASSRPDENIKALATRLACCTRDEKDRTPLVVAVQNEKMPGQYIKEIIAVYPQAVDHAVRKGHYLPLHLAIKNNTHAKESVIRNLLKANPKTIQAVTKSGNTPLHVACQQSHPNAVIIKLLLERYRDASRIRNKAGKLPMDLLVVGKSSKSLLKKVPGLVPSVEETSNSPEPLAKSISTLSPSKPTKSSSSNSKKKDHLHRSPSSSSSNKKKAAAATATATATTCSDKKSRKSVRDRDNTDHASKSSSSSTVHSTDGSDNDDGGDISDKVSCLTETSSHF